MKLGYQLINGFFGPTLWVSINGSDCWDVNCTECDILVAFVKRFFLKPQIRLCIDDIFACKLVSLVDQGRWWSFSSTKIHTGFSATFKENATSRSWVVWRSIEKMLIWVLFQHANATLPTSKSHFIALTSWLGAARECQLIRDGLLSVGIADLLRLEVLVV